MRTTSFFRQVSAIKGIDVNRQNVLFATILLLILPLCTSRTAMAQTTVAISPTVQTANIPAQFSVDVLVNNVANLQLAHLIITFDSTLIRCVKRVRGPFLNSGGQSALFLSSVTAHSVTIDAAFLGAGTVSGSGVVTTLTFSTFGAGVSPVLLTAVDLRDGSNASISAGLVSGQAICVDPAATATTVISSGSPTTFGDAVTFTAAVSASSGTPTGTIQFRIDGADFGGAVTLTGASATSGYFSTLTAGTHVVSAVYSGDENHSASTGTCVHVVNRAGTTTLVTSSNSPAMFGEAITFTAAVGPGGPINGTVQFRIDGVDFGAVTALAGGCASSGSISTLSATNHTVDVLYTGDDNHAASTGTFMQIINKAVTSTTVTSSKSPATPGDSLTFTATIAAGSAAPGGKVQFTFDDVDLGPAVTVIDGNARSVATRALGAGYHTVVASYSGDTNHIASKGSFSQVISVGTISTALVSSKCPSTFGDTVSFTATLVAGTVVASGTVQFKIDGAEFGTAVSLVDGTATSLRTSALAAGEHTVMAVYSGDRNFSTDTGTFVQVVGQAGTATRLTSSKSPSTFGDSLSFIATVSSGDGMPTGNVQFRIDSVNFGVPVTMSNGVARSGVICTLAAGDHAVTAVFSGDSNYRASAGTFTQVVNEGGTTDVDRSTKSSLTSVLYDNYPNPFNPTTTIRYELPFAGLVTIDVFNVRGEQVFLLVNQMQSAGFHSITWNGRNGDNQPVASGLYLYRIHAGNFLKVKKMLLLK